MKMKMALLLTACILGLSAGRAHAQEDDETLDRAINSIQAAPPAPAPAPAATTPAPDAAAESIVEGEALAEGDEVVVELPPDSGNTLQLAVNLYGNMGASFTSQGGTESSAFSLGRAVVILGADVGQQVRALGELTFKAASGDGNVERLYLAWSDGKYFVTGGRLHADVGYWNTAYHHGLWLQLPIDRPSVLSFGGGLLPVHVIGVRGGIDQPLGDGSLRVLGAISNGRGDDQDDVPVVSDTNNFKSLLLTLTYSGLVLPDLSVNVGVSYDRIAAADALVRPALPGERIHEWIANTYATYTGERLTVIAEAFLVSHSADSRRWQTWDAFALVGYKMDDLVPYVMLEWQSVPPTADPFYVPDTTATSQPFDFVQSILGARWRLGGNNTIKLEYRLRHPLGAGDDTHVVAVDWAFGI